MAATSSAHHDGQDFSTSPPGPPPPTLALAATNTVSRRLPPPCWSHDETAALIDAYRDKWYSLRRGHLRANHWQEVADDVAARCPVTPPKTAVQCRHKMEKLRKRYRGEIQRAAPYGGAFNHRYISAWIHFKRMDAMERGPAAALAPDEEDEHEDVKPNNIKPIGDIYRNNNNNNNFIDNNRSTFHVPMNNGGTGFRIRLPARHGEGPAMAKVYSKFDEFGMQNHNPNPNPDRSSSFGGSSKVLRVGYGGRGEMGKRVTVDERKKDNPIGEMVEAIRGLGEGFVRMERMKMEMAREVEEMRMEMEMKRTEMILESQQRIVEAFAKAISERKCKKAKKIPT